MWTLIINQQKNIYNVNINQAQSLNCQFSDIFEISCWETSYIFLMPFSLILFRYCAVLMRIVDTRWPRPSNIYLPTNSQICNIASNMTIWKHTHKAPRPRKMWRCWHLWITPMSKLTAPIIVKLSKENLHSKKQWYCLGPVVFMFAELLKWWRKMFVKWRCWLGNKKGILPVKTEWWGAGMVICLQRGADLHTAQRMPLPLTVSCFSKIQISFTFLILAHPGSPGKRAVKRVCVCAGKERSIWTMSYILQLQVTSTCWLWNQWRQTEWVE